MSGSFGITGSSLTGSFLDSGSSLTSAALGLSNSSSSLSDDGIQKLAGDLKSLASKIPGIDLSDGLSADEISKIKDYIKENGLEDQYKDLLKALDDESLLDKLIKAINGETAPASGGGKAGGKGGGDKGGGGGGDKGGGGGGDKAGGKGDLAGSPLAKLDTDKSGTLEASELAAADTNGDKSLSVSELEDAGLTSEEAQQAEAELGGGENSIGNAGVGIEFSDILAKFGADATEKTT